MENKHHIYSFFKVQHCTYFQDKFHCNYMEKAEHTQHFFEGRTLSFKPLDRTGIAARNIIPVFFPH